MTEELKQNVCIVETGVASGNECQKELFPDYCDVGFLKTFLFLVLDASSLTISFDL